MPEIMLCADTTSIQYPECLGLEEEPLVSQKWLHVYSDAQEARLRARETKPDEIWVAGSDSVEAINLAAALKNDDAAQKVFLIAFKGNGSLLSRAQAASINGVWDKAKFLERYRQVKAGSSNVEAPHSVSEDTGTHAGLRSALQPEAVHESRTAPLPDTALLPSSDRGYLLSVVGAGGGVGKSCVSVVAAYLTQSKGYRTVLVDADLQFGDVQYLTGREDTLALDEALSTPGRLEALESRGRQPAILSAPERLELSEELAPKMPALINELRKRFDVVVVNTSPAWSDLHLHLLETGNNTLFLLDQRPSSIRSCKHALSLCARCGIATQPLVFALNKCSRQSLFSSIDVTCALKGAHVVELSDGGRDVEEMLGTGAPVELLDSGNQLCQSLARALADLLPKQQGEIAAIAPEPARKRFRFVPKRKKAACL